MDIKLEKFCQNIGYQFHDFSLLNTAISHPSINQGKSSKQKSKQDLSKNHFGDDYERLEFMGDKVLSLVICEFLLKDYWFEPEGKLSRRHSKLVCGEILSEIGSKIGLPGILIMSNGERKTDGANNKRNLENAMEALIAAIYFDGGIIAARNFIWRFWQEFLQQEEGFQKDPVSCLQELTQEVCKRVPKYLIESKTGANSSYFFVAKLVFEEQIWQKLQKSAEQKADELKNFILNLANLPNPTSPKEAKIKIMESKIEICAKGMSKKEAARNVAVKALVAIFS